MSSIYAAGLKESLLLVTSVGLQWHKKCVFDLNLNQIHQISDQILTYYFSNGQIEGSGRGLVVRVLNSGL